MMDELQALNYIHSRKHLNSDGSLIRLAPFLNRLGHPEKKLPFIHVTGTNGKGSACAMLSSILQAQGKKTGLFISPFVIHFRERIQINGRFIPKEKLCYYVELLAPIIEELDAKGMEIAEFEMDTLIALLYFADEGCDVAILEVGVGGRFDATNVIPAPIVSVLMGISYDHTKTLGPTLYDIAGHKADIIKGNPAVLYPIQQPEVVETVMKRCAQTGSKLCFPNAGAVTMEKESLQGTVFQYGGERYELSLLGHYQVLNAVTAIEAARIAGVPESCIKKGLKNAVFPVRLELVRSDPPLLIDGAHNPHGMEALYDSVRRLTQSPITLILGMFQDKDFVPAVHKIASLAEKIYTVTIDFPRSAPASLIAETAREVCPNVTVCQSYGEALSLASKDPFTLVCGSLYLASDIRAIFHPFTE